MLSKSLFVAATVLSSYFSGAGALGTGAIGCLGDEPAVSGLHLSAPLKKTGSLAEGSLVFSIDGIPLVPGVPFPATIGEAHYWTINVDMEGLQARPFRGFLVRMAGGDSNVAADDSLGFLDSESEGRVQEAIVCQAIDGVGGVTHTSPEDKNCVLGSLILDEVSDNMPLDVTVVIENRDNKSAYFYTQFLINAVVPTSTDVSRTFPATCDAPPRPGTDAPTMVDTVVETEVGTFDATSAQS